MENLKELKASVNIADIIGPRIDGGLKKNGAQLIGLCPFHTEKTPSLQVSQSKQIFKCFGCGEAGDVFDFLIRYQHTLKEAVDIVKGLTGQVEVKNLTPAYIPEENRVIWKQVKPVPKNAAAPDFKHYTLGEPSRKWCYRDLDGNVLGYVLRFEVGGGKKEHRFLTYCTDGNKFYWRYQGFEAPKPLYNLQDFKNKPSHNVLIVEGEKAADAGVKFFEGKMIVTCWQGGSQSTHRVDWSVLEGRNVYLWPDNDTQQKYGKDHPRKGEVKDWREQPGNAAMLEIYQHIKSIAKSVKWVKNAANFKDKWDIADVDGHWSNQDVRDYFKANIIPVPGTEKRPDTPPPAAPKKPTKKWGQMPYKVLGFEQQDSGPHKYYFYSYHNNSTVALRPDQMKEVNLTSIAPLEYWSLNYPGQGKREGIDIKAIVNSLVIEAHKVGVISFDDFRGRGAWLDQKRIVIHAGDHLIVDGVKTAFHEFESRHIYEQSRHLDIDLNNKLTVPQATELLDICKMFKWERTVNSYLAAGWIVISPVCGVLNWRPHIWVTGGAGVGKSTFMHQVLRAMIQNVALVFQASTTEPGIRQRIKRDAVPILFDEADVDNRQDADRIQSILSLMRASSSSDGGEIAKGTSGQVARSFTTKTCFAFASIALQVSATQDRSRVTILGLEQAENNPDKYAEILRKIAYTINEDYAKAMQARTIGMLPTILKNATMLARAAAVELGRQRTGDQLGALLAGAYSLEHDGEIGYEEALEWVKGFDWAEEKGLESTKDELLLLQHLMEQVIQIENADGIGKIERNIGEMIKAAARHIVNDPELSPEKAESRLRRLGIKVDGNWITISNTSFHIRKYLEGTPWAKNHNKILSRLKGSRPVASTAFTTDLRTRAVEVPLGYVSDAPAIMFNKNKPEDKVEGPQDQGPPPPPDPPLIPLGDDEVPF